MGGYAPVGYYSDEDDLLNGGAGGYAPAVPASAYPAPAPPPGSVDDLESRGLQSHSMPAVSPDVAAPAMSIPVGSSPDVGAAPAVKPDLAPQRPVWKMTPEQRAENLQAAANGARGVQTQDYAPAEPHGWAKAGHVLAAMVPPLNKYFNEDPQARAVEAYKAATGEFEAPIAEQQKEAETEKNRATAENERAQAEARRNPPGQIKEEQILYDKNGTPIGYRDEKGVYHGKDDPALPPGVKAVLTAAQPKTKPAHVSYDAGIPVSITAGDGTVYDVNDPDLPAELKPLVESANRAHGTHVQEQKDVQASGQSAAEKRQQNTEDFQKQEKGREHITKIEGDYQDAASKAELIRDAISQAKAGNKMAASFQGMLATLGITTMEGVKRINAVELGIPTGAGSLWDTVRNKLGKWTAGQPMDADLQKDLTALADTIQKASYKKYAGEHGRISKRYGLTDEAPLPAPAGMEGGEAPAIGTVKHYQDSDWRFKGGDQYDQKNWEKVTKP